jgi:hypothetical protein
MDFRKFHRRAHVNHLRGRLRRENFLQFDWRIVFMLLACQLRLNERNARTSTFTSSRML